MFQKNDDFKLEAYTDADWAGSMIDRRSTTGYCTFLEGHLVTWRSKKQSVFLIDFNRRGAKKCEKFGKQICRQRFTTTGQLTSQPFDLI